MHSIKLLISDLKLFIHSIALYYLKVCYLEMKVKRCHTGNPVSHKEQKYVSEIGPLCPVYG